MLIFHPNPEMTIMMYQVFHHYIYQCCINVWIVGLWRFIQSSFPYFCKVEATHLITASLMSAPASLAISKMFWPETETPRTNSIDVKIEGYILLFPTLHEPLRQIGAQPPVQQNRPFLQIEPLCTSPLAMTVKDFKNVGTPVERC